MQSIADENKLFFVWKNYQRMGGEGKDRPRVYEDITLLDHPHLKVINPEVTNHQEDLKPLCPLPSRAAPVPKLWFQLLYLIQDQSL